MILTLTNGAHHTESVLQLIFRSAGDGEGTASGAPARTLVELSVGQQGVLDKLDLPAKTCRRLMELGFLPGSTVVAAHSAPGGDPKVFRVDGSEIALRCETASRIHLRNGKTSSQ